MKIYFNRTTEAWYTMEGLLYFDETQNVKINVNLLISTRRLTNTTQNNWVQNLHYDLRFVKVKQQTLCLKNIHMSIFRYIRKKRNEPWSCISRDPKSYYAFFLQYTYMSLKDKINIAYMHRQPASIHHNGSNSKKKCKKKLVNQVSTFSRCLNGTFPWRKCLIKR